MLQEGITPIAVVRREEQATLLKEKYKSPHVLNSSANSFDGDMTNLCKELGATVCLECIAGATVGQMLTYL